MSAGESTLSEDLYAAWLAACDAALATGDVPPAPDADDLPAALKDRFVRGLAGLRLLDQLRSPRASGGDQRPAPASSAATEPSAATGPPSASLPWTSLGRFQLRRELGRGGCGVVYLAYDPLLHREVALKVPHAATASSPELRERFMREARAASALDHPHLVPVHEVGEVGPVCYIVSAFAPGVTLAEWLRNRTQPVPHRGAAALVQRLAEAVAHAHGRGVVHRDLKPANILLVSGGMVSGEWSNQAVPPATHHSPLTAHQPRITDFGLAKFLEAAKDGLTKTGVILGTVNYMAPEQAAGKAHAVGPATDIHALGAILYELLTGRPPFQGESDLETLRLIESADPLSPARLRSGVPRDLETICLKCLQKDPRRRYTRAAALAEDLGRYLDNRPVLARRATPFEVAWRWCRRHRAVAALAAIVTVLLVVVIGGSLGAAVWLGRQRDAAVDAEKDARAAQRRAEEAQTLAERRLYDTYLLQAQASRSSGRPGQRRKALEAVAGAAKLLPKLGLGKEEVLKLRNEAIAALSRADLRLDCQWPAYPPGIEDALVAFDADGESYALREDDHITIRRLSDNAVVTRLPGLGPIDGLPFMRFSRDDRWLAVQFRRRSERFVQVWDIAARKPLLADPISVWPYLWHRGMDLSADGRALVLIDKEGTIALHELPSGRRTKSLLPGSRPHNIRFHPKANKLAVIRGGRAFILDVESGKTELNLPCGAVCEWSSDGQWLACCQHGEEAHIFNARTGALHATLRGHSMEIIRVAVHSAGNIASTCSWDGTTRLWDLRNGRQLVMDEGLGVEFNRDGRWLARNQAGQSAGRWEVLPSREYRCLARGHKYGTWAMDFSPDGRLLASHSDDGVRLSEVATGAELAFLPEAAGVLFHPSGAGLICGGPRLVCRPLERDASGTPRLGPAKPLLNVPTGKHGPFSMDTKGQVLVVNSGANQVLVTAWQEGTTTEAHLLGEHGLLSSIAVSPDGRWAATGTHNGYLVKVWDLNERRLEKELPARTAWCAFSPDGQWLLVSGEGEYRFYQAGPWELKHRLPCGGSRYDGPMAFSRDGKLLAIAHGARRVKILDAESRTELATLFADDDFFISSLCWRPDGDGLAVGTTHGAMYWDLRLIRTQLAGLGLDW
jgi:WD40 repeat protein/tRNA A-37 threonylcarbamoyl transferase component Bud32